MHIDVYIVRSGSNIALHDIPGFTYFKNNYSKYFRDPCNIYIRCISSKTKSVGKWRFLPNRSKEFYRCQSLPETYSALISQRWLKELVKRIRSFNL